MQTKELYELGGGVAHGFVRANGDVALRAVYSSVDTFLVAIELLRTGLLCGLKELFLAVRRKLFIG